MVTESFKFDLPDNETDRIQRLRDYCILDSHNEHAFDNLAHLASGFFDTSIALIGFMDDDREWYKAVVGVDWSELDRKYSLSNLVLNAGDIVMIDNTREDSRCEGSDLVEGEPAIRSFAGAPLKTSDGLVIGTLSVMDRQPRCFNSNDRDMLNRLASETMTQIDLRYRNEERRKVNQDLREELQHYKEKLHEKTLEHKELLHRTKNHFTRIKSLLSLQKAKIKDESNYQALELAETRLHTFISLHDQLNEAKQSTSLSSLKYLESITRNIGSLFSEEDELPTVTTNIEDLVLPNDIALKFGLVLNELITNAYQHVFLEGRGSSLTINFYKKGGYYQLEVSDDGPGYSEREDLNQSYETGLQLIKDLVEYGGDGSLQHDFDDGAHFTISLPVPETTESGSETE